jgi:GTP-binding protein HflX
LIASFKATLEETRQADLLLHVADASNPAALDQIRSVYYVLEELGIEEKDTLLVLNKIDRTEQVGILEAIQIRYPRAISVSAHSGQGLSRLATVVSEALSRHFLDVDIETTVGNGRLLAYLAAKGEILSRRYHDDQVIVHCRIPQKYLGRLPGSDAEVRTHAPNGNGHQMENAAPDVGDGVSVEMQSPIDDVA